MRGRTDTVGDAEDRAFVRDTLRFFEVEAPTFSYKRKTAIRDGYLVPYQIYKARTVKTAAEGGFDVKKAELDWSVMDPVTRAELEKVFGDKDTIIVDLSALERRASRSRNATAPSCASTGRCSTTATSTPRACCASRC